MTHHTASRQEAPVASPADHLLTFLHELLRPLPADGQTLAARRGRPPTLSSDHLWVAMLVAILRGLTGFASVWRLITWTGVGHFPVLGLTRAAVRKRLLQSNLASLHELLRRVSSALLPWTYQVQDEGLAPFATEVLALDQSTLDAVRRTCEAVRPEAPGSPRLLVGKLAGLFDVRRQQWVRVLFREDVFAHEKPFVEELFLGIPPGALILADLGYFSFPWFDWLTEQGCWWLSRMREKTSYRLAHVLVRQGSTLDALIWLGASRCDRAKHLVRLIEFEHAGIHYRSLTNVCDPTLEYE